jgi:hypothetical protein
LLGAAFVPKVYFSLASHCTQTDPLLFESSVLTVSPTLPPVGAVRPPPVSVAPVLLIKLLPDELSLDGNSSLGGNIRLVAV